MKRSAFVHLGLKSRIKRLNRCSTMTQRQYEDDKQHEHARPHLGLFGAGFGV